jgi:tetratricopeptide (TPR) repeat protein
VRRGFLLNKEESLTQFLGKIALVMMVFLLVFIDPATAQSDNSWQKDFREVHDYVNSYMLGYNLAPRLLQQAMEDENNRAAQVQRARNEALGFVQTGVACLDKKDWNGAIANFTKAANADPSFDMPFKGRSIAYSQRGDYDRALSDCDQALRLNATDAEVRALRGTIYYNKGDYSKAVTEYTYAIRINPKNAQMYFTRGNIYCQTGDYSRGRADFMKALELDPNLKEAQNALAVLGKEGR